MKVVSKEVRITVVCEKCASFGIVRGTCHRCNGTGVHKKTIKWHKAIPITIDRIDRCPHDIPVGCGYSEEEIIRERGSLRYWIDAVSYYAEAEQLIHFTVQDAENECRRRNIAQLGKDVTDFLEKKLR